MKSSLRRIGNSRGVLIPAAFLSACDIEDAIELRMDQGRIIIEPVKAPREGWFDGYVPGQDEDAWADFVEPDSEPDEWDW